MIGELMLAAALSTATGDARGAVGLWRSPEDGGTLIRVAECGDWICGRVVSSTQLRANPDQRDVRNPDQTLRARPVRDLLVLKARLIAPNRWGGGWVYDPLAGATYSGMIELESNGTLRLTGCVVPPFCRKQTWDRAE